MRKQKPTLRRLLEYILYYKCGHQQSSSDDAYQYSNLAASVPYCPGSDNEDDCNIPMLVQTGIQKITVFRTFCDDNPKHD